MKNFLIICAIAISFLACEKPSGEGGTSVVQGVVYKTYTLVNDATGLVDTILYLEPNIGKDVFIIYADNEGGLYDDKFKTDYNGKYRFEYLRKGDYTIYTYADSMQTYNNQNPIPLDALLKYDYPIFKHIKITSNNSTNTLDDFIIEKNQ